MRQYNVVVSEDAVADFAESIRWGIETWGDDRARRWYADMRSSIRKLLGTFPLSQPIAPDNDEYELEVRQMVVNRYRVLFTVSGKTVTILHIRGPYSE
jgi:plasmid stabilization system protein ParE